jgi:V8-like Glu-specific endopeptidase
MTRRIILGYTAFLAIAACSDAPTNINETPGPEFITDGRLDGNDHPAVVLVLGEVDGRPNFRCSGTLLSATIVLTAGHCTADPERRPDGHQPEITAMRIFTESDVEAGIRSEPRTNNYPLGGKNSVEAKNNGWHTHPEYTNRAFFLHDVGIIELAEPVDEDVVPPAKYGQLPEQDGLDALRPRNSTRFTAVGYGLQNSNPVPFLVEALRTRMRADPHLVQINVPGFTGDFSLLLSNNASTGGTCFGDSGGPNYLGNSNVIAGVTSFGLNGTCGGTGGVFRLDRENVLDFVNSFLD